jgi:hypothetical protein
MATTTKQSKKSGSEFECKWCKKSFKTERTLVSHLCVKKRRWSDRNATHVRLAFRVYQMFYDYTMNSSKPKTEEDFIQSQYYTDFVKFGRSCMVNEYLNPEGYAKWLIENGVKLKDWSKDKTYDDYLLWYVKREPGLKALERTIIYLAEWAENTGNDWQDYFIKVSTNRAVHDIRSAKISPWVIYLSNTGDQLLTRFVDEQITMIEHIIDANFWLKVFKDDPEEVDAIQETCTEAGI